MRVVRVLVLALFALVGASCGPNAAPAQLPRAETKTFEHGYYAGMARADITPPLHLAMWGHGPEGRIATGVRLRLRCQPLVVATKDDIVALVPCDLPAPSLALHRAVAERVRLSAAPIPAQRILIMATHTHAGPAHYHEARRYSGSFTSMAPGFDDKVLAFLADRIAASIVEAFNDLKPACLGWRSDDTWEAESRSSLTFNRAYVPFLANKPSPKLVADTIDRAQKQESQGLEHPLAVRSGAEAAVDARLRLLRVEHRASEALSCAGGTLRGVFAVFGMHPTGAPNTNDLYNGDIFGFATRSAESCLSSQPRGRGVTSLSDSHLDLKDCEGDSDNGDSKVVVGLANGIEGDVVPAIVEQSMPEARRMGRKVGWLIAASAQSDFPMVAEPAASEKLAPFYWEVSMPAAPVDAPDITDDDGSAPSLCREPAIGSQAGGGAINGPTRLRVFPEVNAGYRPRLPYEVSPHDMTDCHRYKLPLREGPTGKFDYPMYGAFSLVRIANGIVATAPGEVTTVTGLRIRHAICANVSDCSASDLEREPVPISVVGLTNSYLQYVATREEYDYQFYEGASTMYGPWESAFFVRRFDCLSSVAFKGVNPCTPSQQLNTLAPFPFSPAPRVHRFADDENGFEPKDPRSPKARRLFRGGVCGYEADIERLPLAFTKSRTELRVEVQRESDHAVIADDRGSSIEIRELPGGERWRVRWMPDIDLTDVADARCRQSFRLSVRGRLQLDTPYFPLGCGATHCATWETP